MNPLRDLSTADKMRVARSLAARACGVAELPDDAVVEMAIDAYGTVHVHASVVAKGIVGGVECGVWLVKEGERA